MSITRGREIVRALQRQGWAVEVRRSGHMKATHPQAPRPLSFSRTPSDSQAINAVLRDARRLLKENT
jgi:predicted RNA binding protein YcfA (HicA-like mRNA interferase family)